ncbi:DUF4160 domain-containing protein [Pseudomonas gingeri]|uniref:DUF4160 domain-containing protein n=1 Tax=Pseudomonas gingeri TaxID=117681 RepID=UPI0015A43BDD|nr:DUF4160 domain-containing protein [Pseudomonas gingeri]NWA24712.1 DUF4160 domain-containing protein [Pseudomonas gingeri]
MEDQGKKLQDSLAMVDMLKRGSSRSGFMELLLKKLLDLGIRMEADHHARAHVHIDYGAQRHTASFSVDTGDRLVGRLPAKYDREIKEWILSNQQQLLLLWAAMKSGGNHAVVLAKLKGK